jgi:hypothetical protein
MNPSDMPRHIAAFERMPTSGSAEKAETQILHPAPIGVVEGSAEKTFDDGTVVAAVG